MNFLENIFKRTENFNKYNFNTECKITQHKSIKKFMQNNEFKFKKNYFLQNRLVTNYKNQDKKFIKCVLPLKNNLLAIALIDEKESFSNEIIIYHTVDKSVENIYSKNILLKNFINNDSKKLKSALDFSYFNDEQIKLCSINMFTYDEPNVKQTINIPNSSNESVNIEDIEDKIALTYVHGKSNSKDLIKDAIFFSDELLIMCTKFHLYIYKNNSVIKCINEKSEKFEEKSESSDKSNERNSDIFNKSNSIINNNLQRNFIIDEKMIEVLNCKNSNADLQINFELVQDIETKKENFFLLKISDLKFIAIKQNSIEFYQRTTVLAKTSNDNLIIRNFSAHEALMNNSTFHQKNDLMKNKSKNPFFIKEIGETIEMSDLNLRNSQASCLISDNLAAFGRVNCKGIYIFSCDHYILKAIAPKNIIKVSSIVSLNKDNYTNYENINILIFAEISGNKKSQHYILQYNIKFKFTENSEINEIARILVYPSDLGEKFQEEFELGQMVINNNSIDEYLAMKDRSSSFNIRISSIKNSNNNNIENVNENFINLGQISVCFYKDFNIYMFMDPIFAIKKFLEKLMWLWDKKNMQENMNKKNENNILDGMSAFSENDADLLNSNNNINNIQ